MRFFKPFLTVAAVAILIAVANVGAKASPVTFSTDAQFNGGAFGAPLVIGAVTLSFQPIVSSSVNTPSNTSLGEIIVSCTAGGTGCGLTAIPAGTTFDIRITQTVPSAGTGTITSTLSGTMPASACPSVTATAPRCVRWWRCRAGTPRGCARVCPVAGAAPWSGLGRELPAARRSPR